MTIREVGLRFGVELRIEDVFTPLEHVAVHVMQAKSVRLKWVHTNGANGSEVSVRAIRPREIEMSLLLL